MSPAYRKIYAVVARVPRGRVATYGQVARLAGMPRHARQVGYALHALEDDSLPWHRIVNSKGELSLAVVPGVGGKQRVLLEREGVAFDARGRIALKRFQWKAGRQESGVGPRPGPLS